VAELELIAEKVARSGLFGLEPEQAFTLCLLAEAEGLPAITALRRWHIIEGRPAMRADAMQAEFQRHGGRVQWVSSTTEDCEAVFTHPEYAPKGFKVRITYKEMERSGITNGKFGVKKNWKTFPRQMLRARVISEGIRAVDPGIVVGIYTPEEVSDFDSKDVPLQAIATVAPEVVTVPVPDEKPKRKAKAEKAAREPGDDDAPPPSPAVVDHPVTRADGSPVARGEVVSWQNELFVLSRATNKEWEEICRQQGIEYRSICSIVTVENYLCDWAISEGKIGPTYLEAAPGRVDRSKQVAMLKAWHTKYPEEFVRLSQECLADVLNEAIESNGLNLDDGAEDVAEVVTAEA
jgi:hypothetical protein